MSLQGSAELISKRVQICIVSLCHEIDIIMSKEELSRINIMPRKNCPEQISEARGQTVTSLYQIDKEMNAVPVYNINIVCE